MPSWPLTTDTPWTQMIFTWGRKRVRMVCIYTPMDCRPELMGSCGRKLAKQLKVCVHIKDGMVAP